MFDLLYLGIKWLFVCLDCLMFGVLILVNFDIDMFWWLYYVLIFRFVVLYVCEFYDCF